MAIKLKTNSDNISLKQSMLKGEPGEKGDPGVYVGDTEPTDDSILVWFNTDPLAAGGFATTDYVDEAINAALGVIENGTY